VPSAPSTFPVNSPAAAPSASVTVNVTCEPFTDPFTVLLPHVPLTVSPVLSRVTRAYTGSSSIGPETSATHLPAIFSAEAPQGHIATPTIANTTIQRIRIVIALLVALESFRLQQP
jgi:hypothetical protein